MCVPRLVFVSASGSGSLIPSPEEALGSRHKFEALGICRRWRLRRTGNERGRESEPEGRSAPERSTKNSAPLLLEHSLSSSSRCASRLALVLAALAARLAHSLDLCTTTALAVHSFGCRPGGAAQEVLQHPNSRSLAMSSKFASANDEWLAGTSNNDDDDDSVWQVKIVVLGDSSSGKTALVRRFVSGTFGDSPSTITYESPMLSVFAPAAPDADSRYAPRIVRLYE